MENVTQGGYMNIVHLCDCMEFMRGIPDRYYDLAIIDPPYGLKRLENKNESFNRFCPEAKMNKWDRKPSPEYFTELFRISKKQIVWGANNFTLPQTEYFIIWDKQQTVDNFASAEYAWTNIEMPAKVFRYSIHKTMQDRSKEGGKIHPTQKPVALYKWLLQNYAKPGDRIFDSHVGSGSIRIACHDMGFDFTGCEIDKDYWEAQEARYMQHIQQADLFTPQEIYTPPTQKELI